MKKPRSIHRFPLLALALALALGGCAPAPAQSASSAPSSALGTDGLLKPPTEEPDSCGIIQPQVTLSTVEELLALSRLVAGGDTTHQNIRYSLAGDLDLAGVDFSPIGSPEHPFLGSFDGAGHTIRRLTLSASGDGIGFFGSLGPGAMVENLVLEDCSVTGGNRVGVLAGAAEGAVIRQCKVYGSAATGRSQVGGLIGLLTGQDGMAGEVQESSAAALVTGEALVGGFVGESPDGVLSNCWADGALVADALAGGFVGRAGDGSILSRCYAVTLPGAGNGLFAGDFRGEGIRLFALERADFSPLSTGGATDGSSLEITLLDYDAFTAKSTFLDWDFGAVWGIDEGRGFPYLLWDAAACSSPFG